MTQWLVAMTALPEDPSWIPSAHMVAHSHHDSSSRDSSVIFLPPWPPDTGVLHTGWQSTLHIQVNLNVFNDNTILPIILMVKLPSFLELVHSI